MLEEKDIKILSRLRNNGRENLTKMSRETMIPVSTIYDRLKKYKGKIINKHTVLLDFRKMGYDLRAQMLMKVDSGKRDECEKFLKVHDKVNSLSRINNGYDFIAEVLFRNMKGFKDFTDRLAELGVEVHQEHFILEDIKREGFLTDEVMYGQAS